MAFREVSVFEVREVLQLCLRGEGPVVELRRRVGPQRGGQGPSVWARRSSPPPSATPRCAPAGDCGRTAAFAVVGRDHSSLRTAQRSGKTGTDSVVRRWAAPTDPPLPGRSPMVRSTILASR
jgi:hypothetical protein